MAGSAAQIILPLAFIFWIMRRSGMGVSYNSFCLCYITHDAL